MTRILVTGSRVYDNLDKMFEYLDAYGATEICEGGAKGADTLAYKYANNRGIPLTTVRAEWDKYGNKAGPMRNQKMLDEFKPDLVMAFPTKESRGTWDMVRRAERAGVEVKIVGQAKRT